ncbi:MAG: hypothetical protein K0V04_25845 [Deltaproteobacteria bacterium]|nr:hypothetical protein [Deltaproteobacteria bacterium]
MPDDGREGTRDSLHRTVRQQRGVPPAPPGTSALPTCIDIDQNGRGECVLSCRGAGVCTVGMVCFMESKPPICLWPD